MRHKLLLSLFALLLLGACATNPYNGRSDVGTRIMGGALLGATAGALAGHALGGHAIAGAAAGMFAGGAIGAATAPRTTPPRQYYRDTRGYCYYIDAAGQPRYNYKVRC